MDNRFYFGFNTSEERKKRRKAELYSMSEQVSTFFWDEAPQHGLEMREGQQDMSFEIVDALINDQHFAIEAGVGIGKSFGYLVPVLLYSKRMNKPVIIATSTIALQEQLWRDVHAVMPLLGFINIGIILPNIPKLPNKNLTVTGVKVCGMSFLTIWRPLPICF